MDKFTLMAPCHFGLEAVLKREITDLGYEIERVDNGRVVYSGDVSAIPRYIYKDCGEDTPSGGRIRGDGF